MTSLRDDQSEEVLPLIIGQDSLQVQDKQNGSSAHFERPDDASRARMALYASHAISTWGQRMWVRTPALLHKGFVWRSASIAAFKGPRPDINLPWPAALSQFLAGLCRSLP